jgi:hypothetical protein
VDRRAFLGTVTGGLLAAPRAAEAQEPGKIARVGILAPTAPVPITPRPGFGITADLSRRFRQRTGRDHLPVLPAAQKTQLEAAVASDLWPVN